MELNDLLLYAALILGIMGFIGFISQENITDTYGELYNYTDGGWTLSIPVTAKYYNLTKFQCGDINNMICDGSNGILQVQQSGIYLAAASISVTAGVDGEYGFGIVKNNENPETIDPSCYMRWTGLGKTTPRSTSCIKRLNTGDKVQVMIDDEKTPTQNAVISTAQLILTRIGD